MRDRGQALPLVLAVVVVIVVFGMAVARWGSVLVAHQQAQAAADSAALAGTVGGCVVAAELAERNGAMLVSCTVVGDDVVVQVRGHGVVATARATRAP